jgi:hypothetical protein
MMHCQIMRLTDPSGRVSGLATKPCKNQEAPMPPLPLAESRKQTNKFSQGGEGERKQVARSWCGGRTCGWFLRQDLRSSARRPRAMPPDAIQVPIGGRLCRRRFLFFEGLPGMGAGLSVPRRRGLSFALFSRVGYGLMARLTFFRVR